jgi:hypothetical protein
MRRPIIPARKNLTEWFAAPLALALVTAAVGACSSSSNSSNPPADAGSHDSSLPPSDATGGGLDLECGQIAALAGGTPSACAEGQTCCTTVSISTMGASAVCVAAGSCTGGISNECSSKADCSGGQVCCAGAEPDAAPNTLAGIIDLNMFETTCQTTCGSTQTQECLQDDECPMGQSCLPIAGGAGGFNLGGFNIGSILGGAGGGGAATGDASVATPMTCQVPVVDAGKDSGESPQPDAATPDSGSTIVDAGVDAADANP